MMAANLEVEKGASLRVYIWLPVILGGADQVHNRIQGNSRILPNRDQSEPNRLVGRADRESVTVPGTNGYQQPRTMGQPTLETKSFSQTRSRFTSYSSDRLRNCDDCQNDCK